MEHQLKTHIFNDTTHNAFGESAYSTSNQGSPIRYDQLKFSEEKEKDNAQVIASNRLATVDPFCLASIT